MDMEEYRETGLGMLNYLYHHCALFFIFNNDHCTTTVGPFVIVFSLIIPSS
jgi:hypothetical protein